MISTWSLYSVAWSGRYALLPPPASAATVSTASAGGGASPVSGILEQLSLLLVTALVILEILSHFNVTP
jgi:hypothetical protein